MKVFLIFFPLGAFAYYQSNGHSDERNQPRANNELYEDYVQTGRVTIGALVEEIRRESLQPSTYQYRQDSYQYSQQYYDRQDRKD